MIPIPQRVPPILLSVDYRGGTQFGANFHRAFPIIDAFERARRKVRLLNVNHSLNQLEHEAQQGVVFVLADTFVAGSAGAARWPMPHGFRCWLQHARATFVGSTYDGMLRASSVDKPRTQSLLAQAGVAVPKRLVVETVDRATAEHALHVLGSPVVAKQAQATGAGVGVHLVDSVDSLLELLVWHRNVRRQSCVLVEEFIGGREVTAWVFEEHGQPFCYGIVETRKPASLPILDQGAKIRCRMVKQFSSDQPAVPEAITRPQFHPTVRTRIEEAAIRAHHVCQLQHYCRVDMIVAADQPYVLDVNAAPEISPIGLGRVAAARGENLPRALKRLVAEAVHSG